MLLLFVLLGVCIWLYSEWFGDYVLVCVWVVGVGVVLSLCELVVVCIFCDGCMYKGVVKCFGIVLVMVWYYLCCVYVKLCVIMKSELICVFDDDGVFV